MKLLKELMEADDNVIDFAQRAKERAKEREKAILSNQPERNNSEITALMTPDDEEDDGNPFSKGTPAIPEELMKNVQENVQEVIDVLKRTVQEKGNKEHIEKIINYYLQILQHQYDHEQMMGMPGFTFATLNMLMQHKEFEMVSRLIKNNYDLNINSKFGTFRNQIKNMM